MHKIVFLFVLILCIYSKLSAQDTIRIKFRVDEKDVTLNNNFKVYILTSKDTFNTKIINGNIIIVPPLNDSVFAIYFKYRKYKIYTRYFNQTFLKGQWHFYRDYRPFDKDYFCGLNFEKWRDKAKYTNYFIYRHTVHSQIIPKRKYRHPNKKIPFPKIK